MPEGYFDELPAAGAATLGERGAHDPGISRGG
jgi:hypothetical protein